MFTARYGYVAGHRQGRRLKYWKPTLNMKKKNLHEKTRPASAALLQAVSSISTGAGPYSDSGPPYLDTLFLGRYSFRFRLQCGTSPSVICLSPYRISSSAR